MKHEKAIKKLEPYVLEIAKTMNLTNWDISLSDEICDYESSATCTCLNGRKDALIRLSEDFWGGSLEVQRDTIVHELLHIVLAPMHNPLAKVLYDPALSFYISSLEYGVDDLTNILAPFLPLPPKIKKEKHEK